MSAMEWQVPISSVTGIAHLMECTEEHKLVKPLCGYGKFNPAFAEINAKAELCCKCIAKMAAAD